MAEAKIVKEPQRAPNGLVPVLLNRRFRKWFPGDVAGFQPDTSAHLVKTGSAQYVEAAKPIDPSRK